MFLAKFSFSKMLQNLFHDNQVLERAMLLVIEDEAYQGTTYLKKVPKRKIHLMTLFRLVVKKSARVQCLTGFFNPKEFFTQCLVVPCNLVY